MYGILSAIQREKGPFKDFLDFVTRCYSGTINKKIIIRIELYDTFRSTLKPVVPSGPLGFLTKTILGPWRATSSKYFFLLNNKGFKGSIISQELKKIILEELYILS